MQDTRRGQGASEYLVILAVVLIVALVAIALLGAFPAFGGDARMSETRQYWSSTQPFAILDWQQQGSTMTLTMKNMVTERLTLTNVSLSNASNTTGIIFNGGAVKTVALAGLRACNASTYDYFEYPNVSIAYASSNLNNRFSGVKPLIGPCIE